MHVVSYLNAIHKMLKTLEVAQTVTKDILGIQGVVVHLLMTVVDGTVQIWQLM